MSAVQTKKPETAEEIYSMISEVLKDALLVEAEKIHLDACLAPDLEATSMDFLDIGFHIAKQTGLSNIQETWGPLAGITSSQLSQPVRESTLEEIKHVLPAGVELPPLQPGGALIKDLVTVRLLCQVVAHKLNVPWHDPV